MALAVAQAMAPREGLVVNEELSVNLFLRMSKQQEMTAAALWDAARRQISAELLQKIAL